MLLVFPVGKGEIEALIMECPGFTSGAPDELQEAFTCICGRHPPDFVLWCQLAAIRTRIWQNLQFPKGSSLETRCPVSDVEVRGSSCVLLLQVTHCSRRFL